MNPIQDAYRPRKRPECLEPIRGELGLFVNRERTKPRLKTREIADRLGVTRRMITQNMRALNKGEADGIGLEFLFRCVEALGYDVKVEVVPRSKQGEVA